MPARAAHGKVVPTWNYATVHAHGSLRWIDDAGWLRSFLEGMTDTHEAGQSHPWHMGDAPEDFTAHLLQAIVGLELRITRLEGKFKLSQNRPAADQQGVLAGLQQQGDAGRRSPGPGDAGGAGQSVGTRLVRASWTCRHRRWPS